MKIYERGNDNNESKYGNGWLFEGLDRVRKEYTARGKALTDRKIRTLSDFIRNPGLHFPIEFKRFKSDSPFPIEGDFTEIFYRQYHLWKKGKAEDPSRYIEDVTELDPLRFALVRLMSAFLAEWKDG